MNARTSGGRSASGNVLNDPREVTRSHAFGTSTISATAVHGTLGAPGGG